MGIDSAAVAFKNHLHPPRLNNDNSCAYISTSCCTQNLFNNINTGEDARSEAFLRNDLLCSPVSPWCLSVCLCESSSAVVCEFTAPSQSPRLMMIYINSWPDPCNPSQDHFDPSNCGLAAGSDGVEVESIISFDNNDGIGLTPAACTVWVQWRTFGFSDQKCRRNNTTRIRPNLHCRMQYDYGLATLG